MTFTVHTRGAKAHLVSWTDGVDALVTGTWEQAVEIAESRTDRETIRICASGLRTTSRDLRAAADYADRASTEVMVVVKAAEIRKSEPSSSAAKETP